ncbi:MAG TPA: response regulator [Acidobacteriota bacterium]|nr:response regulator [Acidobacteriota bacterium]
MEKNRDKVNILMVDDMPSKLLSYEAILGDLGENLIKATSAREALAALLKDEFAVVLMDVSMPEVDGFELAAMIHEHPRHIETAIIFVSGVHLSDLDRIKAYQRGAVDYVSVPIIAEILRAKVGVFVELYRKRQQLEQVNLELERRVAERTEELQKRNEELQVLNKELIRGEDSLRQSEHNLQQALSAAEKANRLKDEFLATVSHELRTPLNTILGWSHILQSSRVEPGIAVSGLAAIASSAKNQTQIINDILDTERIVNGKMDLQPQSVSLTELLSSAFNTLAHAISAKNIRVTSNFGEGTTNLFLYVDAQRLQQVFWNVLSNAVKFSPNGGKIDIEVKRNELEASISFQDWGKGISPEFLPFVFERFRQEDSSTTRKFGGLGLGLSIAQHLVELHGGSITAESEGEERGSKFSIHLPSTLFTEKQAVQLEEPEFMPVKAGASFPNLLKARILFVDDDPNTLALLAQTFNEIGAEVRSSHSGFVALGVANFWQPDLLVSDIAMPDHDGYWLIRQIRSGNSSIREIPAIALTAHASPTDQSEALSSGYDGFLAKPIEPGSILDMANRLLDSRKTSLYGFSIETPVSKINEGLRGKKILLLEDDLLFTEVLRMALQAEGLVFRSAATASEAFSIVKEWSPDAIISDLGLPEEDGFAFMEKIRKLPLFEGPGIPVLALSGYGVEEGNRALAAGFRAFKTKPVEPDTVVSFLAELFRNELDGSQSESRTDY